PLSTVIVLKQVVHLARWLGTAGLADDLRRNTGHRRVVRHRLEHDRACSDARAMADLDVAEDLGARADQYAAADFRMTISRLLAGAAERHLLQDRHVILDHRGLAYHEAGRMIEEDSAP